MNEKEQLIQNISNSMPVTQELKKLEDEVNLVFDKIYKKEKFWKGWKVLTIIDLIIFVPALILSFSDLKELPGVLLFGIPVYLFIWHKKDIKKKEQNINELKQKHSEVASDSSLSWLPAKYRDSFCISKIADYINVGRADTLKEAINMLEQEIKQEELKEAALIGAYYGAQSNRY